MPVGNARVGGIGAQRRVQSLSPIIRRWGTRAVDSDEHNVHMTTVSTN